MRSPSSTVLRRTRRLTMAVLFGICGLTTQIAWGNGWHGGRPVGWGGHFVHRPSAHLYPRVHPGFHGYYGGWHRYRGYGFAPGWGYGLAQPWYGGVGYGWRCWPGHRRVFYGPAYGWNTAFNCWPGACGWTWPNCTIGTGFFWAPRPVVPLWRARVIGGWPLVDSDVMPAAALVDAAPAAPWRFAGIGPLPQPPEEADAVADRAPRDIIDPLVRESSSDARRRATAYVELGDKLFRRGQTRDALAQYKLAATAAPDLGSPYYRQAITSVALRRYDDAVALLRRAVQVDPRFVRSEFCLDLLYGERQVAKADDQEQLAAAALARSSQPELFYLVGVLLHFDGDLARAQKFLAHAWRLRGDRPSEEIATFLAAPGEELAATALDL